MAAKKPVIPADCWVGSHHTKKGGCTPAPPIKVTAADRKAGADQHDIDVCAGDPGCLVARPLKRKLKASGAQLQSLTCINDVGNHLKCLASSAGGGSVAYDVTADPSTGRFIYQTG